MGRGIDGFQFGNFGLDWKELLAAKGLKSGFPCLIESLKPSYLPFLFSTFEVLRMMMFTATFTFKREKDDNGVKSSISLEDSYIIRISTHCQRPILSTSRPVCINACTALVKRASYPAQL